MDRKFIVITITLSICAFLAFSVKGMAQITGQFYQDGYPYPMVKIYFEDVKPKASSDFDGNFLLKIPNDTILNNLIINYSGITLYITHCPLDASETLDLGTFILPKYKVLSETEYKALKRKERKQCRPLYNGSTLIGYESNHQFALDKLPLHCEEGTGISDFIYEKKHNHFTMSWEQFIHCK